MMGGVSMGGGVGDGKLGVKVKSSVWSHHAEAGCRTSFCGGTFSIFHEHLPSHTSEQLECVIAV